MEPNPGGRGVAPNPGGANSERVALSLPYFERTGPSPETDDFRSCLRASRLGGSKPGGFSGGFDDSHRRTSRLAVLAPSPGGADGDERSTGTSCFNTPNPGGLAGGGETTPDATPCT